jgi:UDP-N-acetyl-D-mannosaminuronate dehydrogenase
VLGVAYKQNVDDRRESALIKIPKFLAASGLGLSRFDPHLRGYVSHRYGRLTGAELPALTDAAFLGAKAT